MKKTPIITTLFSLSILTGGHLISACSKSSATENYTDQVSTSVNSVTEFKAYSTDNNQSITLNWKNPADKDLYAVELTIKNKTTNSVVATTVIQVSGNASSNYTFKPQADQTYTFSLTSINAAGVKSKQVDIDFSTIAAPLWLRRADTLLRTNVKLMLDNKPRDIWMSSYPQNTTGFWDGAGVVWDQGSIFSGYTTLKIASEKYKDYKNFIAQNYDNRFLIGIDKFRNKKDGKAEAYAVYPGATDERYYDDNVWIGIDMAKLYLLTNDSKYLDRAKLVWNFVKGGTDNTMGGGVYWVEGGNSKNTCSTAPTAVLAAKLHECTKDVTYLNAAKELYSWVKKTLQDPSDFLYYDNVSLTDPSNPNSALKLDKAKFSYNSGQPLQAAVLLYKLTQDKVYLTDAQQLAKAIYDQWTSPFYSYVLNKNTRFLNNGHIWFYAITLRGLIELYKVDKNRTYVDAFENTLEHIWRSNARDKTTLLLNDDFKGITPQDKWTIIYQGAYIEMMSALADLKSQGL